MPTSLEVRPSRASSIVSTITNSTIATLQDDDRSTRSARSIDLMLGGRLFHINRDGSKISSSSDNDLPPYSPSLPTYAQSSNHVDTSFRNGPQPPELVTSTARTPSPLAAPAPKSRIHIPFWTDRSRHRRLSSSTSQSNAKPALGRLNSNSMFDLSKLPSASLSNPESQPMEENGVYRSPWVITGPERISIVSKGRSASQGNIPESVHSCLAVHPTKTKTPLHLAAGLYNRQAPAAVHTRENTHSHPYSPHVAPPVDIPLLHTQPTCPQKTGPLNAGPRSPISPCSL
ncbi:uncharacterized protein BDCG_08943 [Blastomyces dermatitidis ER-3]|uniref:Uncharacterized protein n=1 Tax=Ajellomyces dermatitidis (strain ER-3 / ATCC MYA-2586) TaxID=559297 RepID=A0ABP2EQ22_AJEDR|nr:uncharacterized protein BDCG_08943 [Blastomyces dermatitidis ER-3]EEQ85674.2 hypothetical protein BDCG_08943 [Blastomyces dermatitidis ER-3]